MKIVSRGVGKVQFPAKRLCLFVLDLAVCAVVYLDCVNVRKVHQKIALGNISPFAKRVRVGNESAVFMHAVAKLVNLHEIWFLP